MVDSEQWHGECWTVRGVSAMLANNRIVRRVILILGDTVVVVLQQRICSESSTAKGPDHYVYRTAWSISDDAGSFMARLQNSIRHWNKITQMALHKRWLIVGLSLEVRSLKRHVEELTCNKPRVV